MTKEKLLALQAALSAASAWISAKLGMLYPMLLVLLAAMIIDYISGMAASRYEAIEHPEDPAYGWSSKKGAKGILKKTGYLCVIAAACIVDYIILNFSKELGITLPTNSFFSLLVAIWYILNEALSIAENAGRMGANVPEWLSKYIAILRGKVDSAAGGDLNDGE